MRRRKILLFALLLLFLVLAALYLLNFRAPAKTMLANSPPNNNPTDNNPENPKGPVLVVPENPFGTLGMMSALAAGFGLFAMKKTKKWL